MDSQLVTQLQAAIRGHLLRRHLIREVREQYWVVAKELEPDLQKDMITWGSNINVISLPRFITTTQSSTKPHPSSETDGFSHKRKKKVKTISTQTETESPVTSRPGVRYMDRSPSQELVDSFSSLSSVDHTPVPPTIKSITMETTKHNLMRSKGTSTNKCHKKKRKHVTSTSPHVASDVSAITQDITQDTTTTRDNHPTTIRHTREYHPSVSHDSYTSTPASQTCHISTTVKPTRQMSEVHPGTTHTTIPVTHTSYTSTPVKCNDTQLSREALSHLIITEASSVNTPNTQLSYDSTPVYYHLPQHSILTRELSSLRQPVITLPSSQIRQDVAQWSKFEQLKAKYLTQGHPVSIQSRLLKHNLT